MSDIIPSPFVRNQYATTPDYLNPIWIGDIVAANQALQTMLTALSGLDTTTDFALFGGFAYTPGGTGTYGPGFFYLNGTWYYQPTTFNEGLRLVPNITGTMPYSYPDDSVTHNTYNVNYSQTGTGATQTPVFAVGGNMDAYRIDNKSLSAGAGNSWTIDNSPTFVGITGGTGTVTSAFFRYYKQGKSCVLTFNIVVNLVSVVSDPVWVWTLTVPPIDSSGGAFFSGSAVDKIGAGSTAYGVATSFALNTGGSTPQLQINISNASATGVHAYYGQVVYETA